MGIKELQIHPFKNRSGSAAWRLSGTLNGLRVRKNFKSAQEAQIEKDRLVTAAAGVEQKIFWTQTRLNADQIRDCESARFQLDQNGFSDRPVLSVVQEWLTNHKAATSIDVFKALEDYLAHLSKLERAGKTIEVLNYVLLGFVKTQGIKVTGQVTRDSAVRWIFDPGVEAETQRGRRNRLHAFCEWLVDSGLLVENPIRKIEAPTVRRERPRILTVEQVEQLLKQAEAFRGGIMLPYFATCVLSGARPQETRRLTSWDAFNLTEHNHFFISELESKTCSRYVPLCERLLKILRTCKERGLSPGVYNQEWFARIRTNAGLGFPWLGPYADVLRHTYASYHYAMFKDLKSLSYNCANSPEILKKHYLVPVTEAAAKEFFSDNSVNTQIECPKFTDSVLKQDQPQEAFTSGGP
jgi:integrase